jgi:hypothetical protein
MMWRLAALVSIALMAAGCGDMEVAGPDGGAEDAAPQEDASLPLKLHVLVGPTTADRSSGAGATVALEGPDGVIGEQTADSYGRVTFTGIDFGKGPVSATAYLEGYPLNSRVGITETPDDVVLWIQTTMYHGRPMVTISGTVAMPAYATPDGWLCVTTSADGALRNGIGWTYCSTDGTWNRVVPAGEPFTIYARIQWAAGTSEARGWNNQAVWISQAHAGVTVDTVIDLDFSSPATTQTTTAKLHILEVRASSPLMVAGTGSAQVLGSCSPLLGGIAGDSMKSAPYYLPVPPPGPESGFDLTVEWMEQPEAEDPCVLYTVCIPEWGACSFTTAPGSAVGDAAVAFLDLPVRVLPAEGPYAATPQLYAPIEWMNFSTWGGASVQLVLETCQCGAAAWTVDVAEGTSSMKVPHPPSNVDLTALLGQSHLYAQLSVRQLDELGYPQRLATLAPLKVVYQ